jgi:hypothetical protein
VALVTGKSDKLVNEKYGVLRNSVV